MAISVRSFAKINIGLRIGPLRDDGYHELRTLYQTIALHDTVRVDIGRSLRREQYLLPHGRTHAARLQSAQQSPHRH